MWHASNLGVYLPLPGYMQLTSASRILVEQPDTAAIMKSICEPLWCPIKWWDAQASGEYDVVRTSKPL